MKFLHLGDLHIGKSLGDFDLIRDQRFILEQILEIAVSHEVDALLIAGDVYDKSIPSEAAVSLFNDFLCQLAERKIKTFLITGNHDSDERLNFGSTLFEASNIFISARYEGILYKQTLTDAYGKLHLYLMPFIKASQVRHFFPDEEIHNYEDAVKIVLKKSGIDSSERNLLVAHQFVAGKSVDPILAGSESLSTQNVGLVERIGTDCFQDFDYVALGHIHSPQSVGRKEIRYSGSPLKYSLSEAGNEKSVPLITVKEKGETEIELIPLHPLRDLRHIKGRMKQLLSAENITSPDDFIYVTLTEEDLVNDAMGIFQQYYPNTVRIDYDNIRSRSLTEADPMGYTETKTFREMFSDFYRLIYGCEISEEELKVMKEIAGEAGVADETD